MNLQLAATRKDDDDIEFKNFSDLNDGAEKTMLSKYLELPLGTQVSKRASQTQEQQHSNCHSSQHLDEVAWFVIRSYMSRP